ncbi:helix-turn-helix transcriptional regulator [Actinomycetospora aeridis]|uniref:LuxR C-terminal-related transcriptional regulator n=1 Tax=Actinomycetospora aeridis TaxID=3129231 RepID=A0ABU8N4K5_9PSEU
MTEGDRSSRAGTPVAPFVGRAEELASLRGLSGAERLVTVVGPGGGGKTRLTLEALAATPGLVGVVELAAATPRDDLWSVVLDACDIRDDPLVPPPDRFARRVGDLVGDRAALLVLDNAEHVRAALGEVVVGLLERCPRLGVVVTSRVLLGVPGEVALPVEGLPPEDAAALFLDRARRARPDLAASADTSDRARRIAEALDGLPLALELAAAHARGLSLRAIEAGTAERLALLAGRGPRAARHRSMQACLTWSTALLGDRARAGLAAVSVIEGRCSLPAALAVIGPPDRAGDAGPVGVLEELVDHSLVRFLPAEDAYLVLETVREHAREVAPEAPRAALARLTPWVAALAAEARPALEQGDLDVLARLDGDAAAIRAVLAHGASGVAAAVVADLAFWWSLRGRCREGGAWAARLGAAPDGDGEPPAGRLRWAHAFHAVYSGNLDEGLAVADALADDPATEDEVRARSMILLGIAAAFDDPAGAAPVLAAAADLAQRAGDRWGRVEALQCLAYTHLWRADHATALACADEAVPALETLGHPQLRAWDAAIRAEAASQRGDLVTARDRGRDAHALAVDVGEPVSATCALLPLARSLCRTGDDAEAGRLLARHAAFLDEHPGLGTAETLALGEAETALWCGAPDRTVAITASLEACADAGMTLVAVEAGALRATALLVAGEDGPATEAAALAATRARERGAREFAITAETVAAAVRLRRGEDVAAEAHDLLAEAHAAGLAPLVVDALELVAAVALATGRTEVAVRLRAATDAVARGRVSPLTHVLRATAPLEGDGSRAGGAALELDAAVAYARRTRGPRGRPRSGWESLTPTERDVVALAARGLRNQDIADQMLIGTGTVRTHLRRIFTKLDLASRTELAAAAARRGI